MTEEDSAMASLPRPRKKYWLIGGGMAIAGLVLAGLIAWHPWKHANTAVLPKTVTARVAGFTPYQPEVLPAGLQVEPSSVSFEGTIFVFRLSKPGKSMTVTEQLSPPGLSDRSYPSEKIEGVDGVGYLSHDGTRTFATLFAKGRNGKPTMVLVNTNDAFTSDEFKDLLRGFRAVE